MYSLSTLKNINGSELKSYVAKHPLVQVNNSKDVFKAPDYSQVDIDKLEKESGLKVVATYFVDSSGFGQPGEAALTVSSFQRIIEGFINQGKEIYACLTGIGQFQVYVSIFAK